MSCHCKFNFRREFILQECHLTALEKIFAVMIALNADIIVIINFEYSEKRISEKYLSLSDIVAKQYNNIIRSCRCTLPKKYEIFITRRQRALTSTLWRGRNPSCLGIRTPLGDGLGLRHFLELY